MIKRITIIALIITSVLHGFADDQLRFIGTAKQVAKVGERFRVVYEINEDADSFQSPNFGSLKVLSGPSSSTNSSIQYVNGKMTRSYSVTYTYVVQATKEGVDTNGYIVNTLERHLHRIRLAPRKLNHRESELLRKINLGLSQESWQRYHELIEKRRAETLTANEQAELIAFSDQIERANARRMEYLVKLAQIRQTSLDVLMKNLGLMGAGYV